ncbi:zinc-binding dehydrogenase [Aureobasidium pullulans]|uniref:Zinc-binding dehydrogenase n=1 Tax=Aureobasidium pullulans TaxID=5580 RepID=A0A4T0BKR0_AURPU|nr:zinc-binding dehydrogenase [Aureobasidium pullulans]
MTRMAQPTQSKQWLTNQDGVDKIYQGEAAISQPGEKEVLVKIHTVSLNYRDTEVCDGGYNHHKSIGGENKALVPGSDMCGTVVKAGPGASLKEGQRVLSVFLQTHQTGQVQESDMASGMGLPLEGVLQEYRVFPDTALVTVPDYLSNEEAATLPIAGTTAFMAMNWMQPMGKPISNPETTVLFQMQGTGGVSISGLQIAKACGLKAIVTSSSDEKLEKARELGADYTINYKKFPRWSEKAMEFTKGKGVDIILECGGAQTVRQSFDSIAFGGLISSIGYLSGKQDTESDALNINVLALRRNVTLKGHINGPKDRFEEMLQLYAQKEIHPVVDKVFSFDETKDAMQYLAKGGHFGKVVIKIA